MKFCGFCQLYYWEKMVSGMYSYVTQPNRDRVLLLGSVQTQVFACKPRTTEDQKSYNEDAFSDNDNDNRLLAGIIPSILARL
jgi:hypothetical protein